MVGSGDDDDRQHQGPRTWYLGDDRDIPWTGDDDFMAWQRRSRSANWWDLAAVLCLVAAIPAGWLLWRLTGHAAIAVTGLVACLVISVGFSVRKLFWSASGR